MFYKKIKGIKPQSTTRAFHFPNSLRSIRKINRKLWGIYLLLCLRSDAIKASLCSLLRRSSLAIIKTKKENGSIVILVLVFAGIVSLMIGGTVGFILVQHRTEVQKGESELSMQIAEAGVNYYRWFLSHYPDDLQDGTGVPGPYTHVYSDPEGGDIGEFTLQISGNTTCSTVSSVDIISTGRSYTDLSVARTVQARYSRPSVAEFAYIIDDNVKAGSDRDIKGKYHSNGGIRMEGTNDSLVTSAQTTWNCTPSFGCNTPFEVKDGVFGGGSGSDLWQFPAEAIDFVGLTLDLAQMKDAAQNSGGVYFPPPADIGYSNGQGYHVVFQSNGTFDIYIVTSISYIPAYASGVGWYDSYEVIEDETFHGNYPIPSACGLIFVEEDLWVEGVVRGKITIASADLINPSVDTSVYLEGNITYTASDGSDGLLVLGEEDVLVPLYVPDDMELNGIFMAQKGHFGRDYYSSNYSPYHKRQSLKMNGSVVSKGRVGTKWSCGGSYCSGFENRENAYDRKLMTAPPPMTPFADDEYVFIKWEEIQ